MNDRLPQYGRCTGGQTDFYKTLFRLVDLSKERVVPAIVESVDGETGLATVRPLVMTSYDTKEGVKNEPRSACEVPVLQMGQGGYSLYTPLFRGDTGYLVAGDRNAATAVSKNSSRIVEPQGEEYSPNEGPQPVDDARLLCFENGFFIPCSWANPIGTVDEGFVFKHTGRDGDDFVFNLKDGNLSVTAKRYEVYGEADFYDDCHFHKSLSVDEDLSVGNNAKVGNILTVKNDVDIGSEDHAHLREMTLVTGYSNEMEAFTTWKGKVVASDGGDGEPIPFSGGGGEPTEGPKFHFKPTLSGNVLTVGRGVVNVGGFTYQHAQSTQINIPSTGLAVVCAKVNIEIGASDRTVEIEYYDSYETLTANQADYLYYIFPLYEFNGGVMTIDYRPMPNAGCWE